MNAIEKDVKSIIIDVSGLPGNPENLADGTTLAGLNYDDSMCDDLAERLDNYVKAKKAGTGVSSAEISAGMNAGAVVAIIKSKLS